MGPGRAAKRSDAGERTPRLGREQPGRQHPFRRFDALVPLPAKNATLVTDYLTRFAILRAWVKIGDPPFPMPRWPQSRPAKHARMFFVLRGWPLVGTQDEERRAFRPGSDEPAHSAVANWEAETTCMLRDAGFGRSSA